MALELKDLTEDETLALVALVQAVAEADTYVTDPEAQNLRGIIRAVGEKKYQAASDEADEKFQDVEDLKAFLKTIDRQEARELIYASALDLSLSDTRVGPEKEVLAWLSRNWNVKVELVDEK
jgi:hypothetical protein